MIEVVRPWEIERTADKWKWGIGYMSMRGLDLHSDIYYEPTKDRSVYRIEKLVEYSLGSRNWIVCICDSTIYMRSLYTYVMASYVFTTGERSIVVDSDDLIASVDDPEGEMRDIVEHANLLIICYCDPHNPQLKFKRGAIANIFHRRKHKGLATMIDIFKGEIEDPFTSEARTRAVMGLTDSFGESVYELFTGPSSKHVIVRSRVGGEDGRTDRTGKTQDDNGVLRRAVPQQA